MTLFVRLLGGLPSSGPLAIPFPARWGATGREGTVVEFETGAGTWVGNFQPGLGGLERADPHPNGHDAVVLAAGDLWVVDPRSRAAQRLLPAIDAALWVEDPPGWVFSRQGLALARLGPPGLLWHTRRLSLDGFDELRIAGDEVVGLGWSPSDDWRAFRVDLRTGRSRGGARPNDDAEGWEMLRATP